MGLLNTLQQSECRLRCPKIQKKGDHEGGGGGMWVDCDTGKCCNDDSGRTR